MKHKELLADDGPFMSAFFLTSCHALMVARLCLAAVAGLAPTGWSRAETFYFGYSGSPDGYVATTARSIVDRLGGRLPQDVTIVAKSFDAIGGANRAVAALRSRQLTYALLPVSILSREVPEFEVLGLPFVMHSAQQGSRALGGQPGRDLEAAAKKNAIAVLGYIWRVGTFVSSRRCLTRPDDLRGARIFDGPDWYARLLNAAGGAAQVVPAAEIGAGLLHRTGDGALFVIEVLRDGQIVEATSCLTSATDQQFMILPEVVISTVDTVSKVPPDINEMLTRSAHAAEAQGVEKIAAEAGALEDEYRTKGNRGKGSDVVKFSEAERKPWAALRDRIYRDFDEKNPAGAKLRRSIAEVR